MQHRRVTIGTATHYTVNSFFGFTGESSWFPVGAVVLIIALNAISWQTTTQTPTGTLGSIALFICRRHCKTVEKIKLQEFFHFQLEQSISSERVYLFTLCGNGPANTPLWISCKAAGGKWLCPQQKGHQKVPDHSWLQLPGGQYQIPTGVFTWGCSRDHRAGDDRSMLGISGVGGLLANMRRAQVPWVKKIKAQLTYKGSHADNVTIIYKYRSC